MEKRKNPEKDLGRKSGLFFQIGLFMAMGLAVSAFEFRSVDRFRPIESGALATIEDELIPITEIKPPPPPKPVFANPVLIETDEPEIEIPDIIIDTEDLPEIPQVIVEDHTEDVVDEPFVIVEKMPEPEGGLEAFYKFVNKKLRYPAQARRMGIEGTVYLEFIVSEKGEMTDFKIAKGIGAGCDEEVIRIFENPPKWKPGKQRGVPVRVRKIIPIKFQLN